MSLSRRHVLAGFAAAATRADAQGRRGNGPKLRTIPAVCLFSQALIKVPYEDLGPILRGLGVDGCDLSVQPGGHVNPEQAGLHLMRAVESITGIGLDVLVLSTSFTSLADQSINAVAAIAGEMGVPIIRAGVWKYPAAGEPEARLGEVQRDLAGLAALARATGVTVALPNVAGDNVGASVWDLQMILRSMDPALVGYDFDVGYAAQTGGISGWNLALRIARPRLKMVTVRDFSWTRDTAGVWKAVPCPLGEGMVDWPRFFSALAAMRFTGPITLPVDYQPSDELAAVRRDVEFVRKHLAAAYGGGRG